VEAARRLFSTVIPPSYSPALKNRSRATNTPKRLPEERLAVAAQFSG
jgi:hypothetical protein